MHSLSHDTDMDSQSCSHSYSHHTDIDMATPPLPQPQSRCRCLCSCFLDHNRQCFHHLTLPLYRSINRPPPHSGLVSYSSDFYVLVCMTNFWFWNAIWLSIYNKTHVLICTICFQHICILTKPLSQARQWPYHYPEIFLIPFCNLPFHFSLSLGQLMTWFL